MENKAEEIKKFWIEAGKNEIDSDGLKTTARDPFMQQINEYHICKYLNKDFEVLDVGCGEGTSTLVFSKNCKNITGIDYSHTLINQAQNKSSDIKFCELDVLELDKTFPQNKFDAVISIRCLINIPDEKLQYKALENIFYVLKQGGVLFLSEGYQDGWDCLNLYRKRNGLDEIKVVSYNKLFNNKNLESFLKFKGNIQNFIGFGDYLFNSRITHPMLTKNVSHNSPINEIFFKQHINNNFYEKFDEFSYAGIYIVSKK